MAYTCDDWVPDRHELEPHTTFERELCITVTVDQEGDEIDTHARDEWGTLGDQVTCECGGDTTWARNISTIYQERAWDEGYGYCTDCDIATQQSDDWKCGSCDLRSYVNDESPDEDDDGLPLAHLSHPIARSHAMSFPLPLTYDA